MVKKKLKKKESKIKKNKYHKMARFDENKPYFNANSEFTSETMGTFMGHLRSGAFKGVKLGEGGRKNAYRLFGNASTGYSKKQYPYIREKVEKWCQRNDDKHGQNNWILFTDGDGDYGHESIETIASQVAERGVPVVFLQSDFGYAEPGTPYWPQYASGGYFGPGVRHLHQKKNKNGELVFDKKGNVVMAECWGGIQEDLNGLETGVLSFVDHAYMNLFEGELLSNLDGMLVVGGGAIVVKQMRILNFGSRSNDKFIIAFTKDQLSSEANKVFINHICRSSERRALNTWLSKLA